MDSLSVERASSPNGFSEFDVTIEIKALFRCLCVGCCGSKSGRKSGARALTKRNEK